MSNPTTLTFDYDQFIALFPYYSNATQYPEATLQGYWNQAILYMSNIGNCGSLQGDSRQFALNLLTAHIAYINGNIAAGQTPFVMTNAAVDKVNVTTVAPPTQNGWRFWLNTSPYGQQLIALLQANIVGGVYVPAPYCYGYYGGW